MIDSHSGGRGPKIEVRGLYKIFGPDPRAQLSRVRGGTDKARLLERHQHVLALANIDLRVEGERIQVVMGLSGSGKSTLLRHLNRLLEPTAGQVLFDGRDLGELDPRGLRRLRRHTAAMVFQRFALLPHRTVMANIGYGLEVRGRPRGEVLEHAERWVERVGLAGYQDRYPGQLSGGMAQRVGLARALATDPEILLMDEAFSALDPLIRGEMQELLLGLQRELGKTIVFITHDLDEALRIGDRIAILRDGRLVQQGSPQDIVLRPADPYVARFVRDINRARVLSVAAVMEAGAGAGGPSLPDHTPLEEALPILAGSECRRATVVDGSGRPVGSLTLAGAVAALARR